MPLPTSFRFNHHLSQFAPIALMALCCCSSVIAQEESVSSQKPIANPVYLPGVLPSGEVLLPNGWTIGAVGTQINVGDFPVNMVTAPDKRYLAVLHSGYGEHEIIMLDLQTNKIRSRVSMPQVFYGLTFSHDGSKLLCSGAEYEVIHQYDYADGLLSNPKQIRIAEVARTFVPCGITPIPDSTSYLTCGVLGHKIARFDGNAPLNVEILDLAADSYPYAATIDAQRQLAYISLWGGAAVAIIDLKTWKQIGTLPTRSHPCEMKLLQDNKYLLVACANDNTVIVFDTQTNKQVEVIQTALYSKAKNGSTPSSIAVSADEKVLFAANAGNNNVAVFNIEELGKSSSLGFIPAGWYPTSVRLSANGENILIANGKGLTSRPNPQGPAPGKELPRNLRQYIGGILQGSVSVVPTPSPKTMSDWTRQAMAQSPLQADSTVNNKGRENDNPIPAKVGDPSPIKHCFYIIKENRTYDQVFGDMPQGNGDPNLCLFPRNVTPNHHALAEQFVLLDNFYVESEVSADGHEWTMAAYATDFVEKSWPMSYRGGGKDKFVYPAEGALKIAEPSSGYLWDACKRAGVDYFSFGEFITNGPTIDSPSYTKIEALKGHFDPQFRGYDLNYPDVKRAERFITRFKQFESENNLPGMVILRLGNDHTSGTRPGKPTPRAMVADNDLALGMVVEAISKSKYWKESAIFVVEDDAQNGADHVDAHRTVGLAISPYIRRGTVDSTLYSTSSMLRTMELILGVEPMTQFDAAARPMYDSFSSKLDETPYTVQPAQIDLNEVNSPNAFGATESLKMDFSKEDAADDLILGDIVWRSVKGPNSPMPAPVRAAFVFGGAGEEEEEEEEEDGDEDDKDEDDKEDEDDDKDDVKK